MRRNATESTRRALWHWLPWRRTAGRRLTLNLALQGGGAHGAFTWGVLDRLLDEESFGFEGLSGASAGAMNAAVFASGWLSGGREGAREALSRFWQAVSASAEVGPLRRGPMDYFINGWNRDWSPGYLMLSAVTKVASPYQFNPTGFNPLRQLLEQHVDFELLRRSRSLKLFIATTNVHTGRLRVLRNPDLSPDALIASACLPLLFQAVELDDGYYWDGGYSANPPLLPLLLECRCDDVLLVQIEPSWHGELPTRVPEIVDRANQIAFNATLQRELELLAQLELHSRSFAGVLFDRKRSLRLHHVETAEATEGFGRTSRINTEWAFLNHLRDAGRARAEAWLSSHREAIGQRSSMNLNEYR